MGNDVFSSIACVKRHISTENRGLKSYESRKARYTRKYKGVGSREIPYLVHNSTRILTVVRKAAGANLHV